MNWKGRVLDPSLPSGRSGCVLHLSGVNLVATLPDGKEITQHLGNVNFTCRGFEKKEYVFSGKEEGYPIFSTHDEAVIKAIQNENILEFSDAFKDYKKQVWMSRNKKYIIPFVLLLSLIGGSIWFISVPAVHIAISLTPISVDREIGQLAIGDITAFGKEVKEPIVVEAIQKIVQRLVKHVPEKEFHFNVRVINSEVVNAFAAPGGEIVVLTGLIKNSDSAEEVAGILAHEISHVTERHGLEGIYRRAIFAIAIAAIFGDVGTITGIAIDGANGLTQLGFSRGMEKEADIEGFKLLLQAGIDPSGLRTFFEKLNKLYEHSDHSAMESLLSTHPLTENRIDYLKQKEKDVTQDFTSLDIDWQAVKNSLK